MAFLILELALAGLLIAALAFGWRLERRLKALRDSHDSFLAGVRDLDVATLRAEAGLKTLRTALDDAHDGLHDRIQKGRALKMELESLLARAERSDRKPLAPAPAAPFAPSPVNAAAQEYVPAVSAFTSEEKPSPPQPDPLGPGPRRGSGFVEDETPSRPLPRFRDRGAA